MMIFLPLILILFSILITSVILTRKPEKICEAVHYLLDNPEKHLSIIKNARELICRDYEFGKRMRFIEKIYDDVLNNSLIFVKGRKTRNRPR